MLLSIIIPTKNEAANIVDCVSSFSDAVSSGVAEVIVVDNTSSDDTVRLAEGAGARVVSQGPERSAQRNRGALKEAIGDYVFFVDADMRVPKETTDEIAGLLSISDPPDALYVREQISGRGFWARVRNFERGFYDATCIDGLRVIRRSLLMEVGGFDESLYAGEDWDLDRRLLARTGKTAITKNALIHDEGAFTLRGHLRKKRYYAKNFGAYCEKWSRDQTVRKQFGIKYRLWTVFMEHGKWRRSLARPDLLLGIWFYKAFVGLMFLMGSRSAGTTGARASGAGDESDKEGF